MRRRPALVLASGCLALLAAAGLAACAPTPPKPTLSPEPSATAPFATDEEALAAAKAAYEKYTAMADRILQDGGENPDRIREVASGSALNDVIDSASEFQEKQVHLVGSSVIDAVKLQAHSSGFRELTIYACQDISKTDVKDTNGRSTVLPERRNRVPRQVELEYSDDGGLVVARDDIWAGDDFCA